MKYIISIGILTLAVLLQWFSHHEFAGNFIVGFLIGLLVVRSSEWLIKEQF